MEVPNPIADRENYLAAMLRGDVPGISSAITRDAVEQARADMEGPIGPRSLGFSVAYARPLYEGGDFQELLMVVTDGTRDAAFVARVSGTAIAMLEHRGTPVAEFALEELHRIEGGFRNDGMRCENVLLHHPLTLTAI
jgi:hypothetical protein